MDTGRGTAERPYIVIINGEADGHAFSRTHDDFFIAFHRKHCHQTVILFQAHGDEAVLIDILIFFQSRLLDVAVLRHHEKVLGSLFGNIQIQKLRHVFIGAKGRDEVDHRASPCSAA